MLVLTELDLETKIAAAPADDPLAWLSLVDSSMQASLTAIGLRDPDAIERGAKRLERVLAMSPTVTALRAHVLGVAQGEAARITAAMPGLGERERRALADLADGIAKKLLHTPQVALRQDSGDPVPLVTAIQRLFALEVAPPAPVAAEDETPDKKAAGH